MHVTKTDHKRGRKMHRSKDRRVFSNTAHLMERINVAGGAQVMRGGIRL